MTEDELREIVQDIFNKDPSPECNIYMVDKRDGKLVVKDGRKKHFEKIWKESLN